MSKKVKKVKAPIRNWVAKHAAQYCKPKVERNKKKEYQRSPKHKSSFGDFSMGGLVECLHV